MSLNVSIILRLIDQLTGPARAAQGSLRGVQNSLQGVARAGASTTAVARGISAIGRASAVAAASVGRLATNMRNMRTLSSGFGGFGAGGAGLMLGFPLVAMVKNAADYESKLLDIRKVWQGTAEDYDTLIGKLRQLNTTIPLPRSDIATLLEEGVKAGISRNPQELADFTQAAAKFAVAFQLKNVEEAATKLAKIKGSLGMSMGEFTAMADSMNTIAGNFATTEADLLEIVRRVGGISKAIGGAKGLADLVVLGGAQTAAGVRSDVAATGLRSLLGRLSQMNIETTVALGKIGLDWKKVQKHLPTDMLGTVLQILKAISKAPIEKQAGLLAKIAGMRTFDAFAPLLGNLDLLKEVERVYKDPKRLTVSAEYERRITGINSALQLTVNALGEVSDSIVLAWKPQIEGLLENLRRLSEAVKGSPILQWAAAIFAGFAALSLLALPFGILGSSIFGAVLGLRALGSVLGFVRVLALPLIGILQGIFLGPAQAAGMFSAEIAATYRLAGAFAALRFAALGLMRLSAVGLLGWGAYKVATDKELQNDIRDRTEKMRDRKTNPMGPLSDAVDSAIDKIRSKNATIAWEAGVIQDRDGYLAAQAYRAKRLWDGQPGKVADEVGPGGLKPLSLMGGRGGFSAPPSIAPGSVTNNTDNSKVVNVGGISVTVNATTNADPHSIGAAAAGAIGAKMRGVIHDGAQQ